MSFCHKHWPVLWAEIGNDLELIKCLLLGYIGCLSLYFNWWKCIVFVIEIYCIWPKLLLSFVLWVWNGGDFSWSLPYFLGCYEATEVLCGAGITLYENIIGRRSSLSNNAWTLAYVLIWVLRRGIGQLFLLQYLSALSMALISSYLEIKSKNNLALSEKGQLSGYFVNRAEFPSHRNKIPSVVSEYSKKCISKKLNLLLFR